MSSWKSASKLGQKTHRERHQPKARSHLGLLEKKKDYKLRAKDYSEKQATLKLLRRKALNRNPDEFHFHMINSRVEDGVHKELEKPDETTPEQLQLMQTQDIRYVSFKHSAEAKKLERLQGVLHLVDAPANNKHTFFVDSKKEAKTLDVAARLDTHPTLLGRRSNRPRLADLKSYLPQMDPETMQEVISKRQKAYNELRQRIEREKQLLIVQQKLEVKRHLQNKRETAPKRIQPATKDAAPIYQWKQERKR